jgi:hypothetical protein
MRSESDDNHCILIWGQGKYRHSVPFSPTTNTPTFHLAPASYSYCAFIAVLHEAMEAQQYRREHVVQIPDPYPRVDKEYIADENLFFDAQEHDKEMSVLEGARPDDETVLTSNLTSSSVNENKDRHVKRRGPHTFDPSPPLDDNDQVDLIAADEQSELMRWHHCLGHLSFAKIKALALAGKIPKKLAKVKPPVCAGCLYAAMTKVNWKGKEAAHGHQVFVATKPGQCVSVDQTQLKGMVTKKRYKAATVFVDHFCTSSTFTR